MGEVRQSRSKAAKPRPGSLDGKLFKQWRQEAGLSLREFCRRFEQKTGIALADSNLSAMEQGRRRIPDDVIALGASILGKDPLDFPEYRLRQIPHEVLTDPFADRILRMLARMTNLDELQRAELRGSAKLLELMESETGYSSASSDTSGTEKDQKRSKR